MQFHHRISRQVLNIDSREKWTECKLKSTRTNSSLQLEEKLAKNISHPRHHEKDGTIDRESNENARAILCSRSRGRKRFPFYFFLIYFFFPFFFLFFLSCLTRRCVGGGGWIIGKEGTWFSLLNLREKKGGSVSTGAGRLIEMR